MHLPSGGFIGSVTDLSLFAKGLINNSIFENGSTRDDMFNLENLPYHRVSIAGLLYFLGIRRRYINSSIYHFHDGADDSSSSIIYFSDDINDAVAIMTNRNLMTTTNILPYAQSLMELIPALNVINPALYNEDNVSAQNLINLSGNQNGQSYHFAKNIMAMDYTLSPSATARFYGENIILKDGFKAIQGAYFLAQLKNTNKGCWTE